ncbi:MAG: TetR/AcrR family transcriptional regulator, partial [Vulcanimicrobiaceae bacterium]
MAHEVIKRVGRRAYRYRVEGVRDPQTQRMRSRWTYLGRLEPADDGRPPRKRRPSQSRDRLLAAFERLLEREPYAAVTASAVAREAGLGHGTFYRHFKEKRALLEAALERVAEPLRALMPSLRPGAGRAEARAQVRAWLEAMLDLPAVRPGLLRAWFEALGKAPELAEHRSFRRRRRTAALAGYLSALDRAGLAVIGSPQELASGLGAIVEAVVETAASAGRPIAPQTARELLALVERAIFLSDPPPSGTVLDRP